MLCDDGLSFASFTCCSSRWHTSALGRLGGRTPPFPKGSIGRVAAARRERARSALAPHAWDTRHAARHAWHHLPQGAEQGLRRPRKVHHTLRTGPLQRSDLDEFVACYHPETASTAFPAGPGEPAWPLAPLWLRGADAAARSASISPGCETIGLRTPPTCPNPDVIAADLRPALKQFEAVYSEVARSAPATDS